MLLLQVRRLKSAVCGLLQRDVGGWKGRNIADLALDYGRIGRT
jgi:hypothetical protein